MISPKVLYICPVFLLVFSPIKQRIFLILFWPSGDGYSLLCSPKSNFRGTVPEAVLFRGVPEERSGW
jgi:hypothetical protein